jgi:hypothetical protein
MTDESHPQLGMTINTGGAAKFVKTPPIEMLQKSSATVA